MDTPRLLLLLLALGRCCDCCCFDPDCNIEAAAARLCMACRRSLLFVSFSLYLYTAFTSALLLFKVAEEVVLPTLSSSSFLSDDVVVVAARDASSVSSSPILLPYSFLLPFFYSYSMYWEKSHLSYFRPNAEQRFYYSYHWNL